MGHFSCCRKETLLREIKTQRSMMSKHPVRSKHWWWKRILITTMINEYRQLQGGVR